MASSKGLDNHHGRTTIGTRAGVFDWGILCDILSGGEGYGNERGYRGGEQLPSPRQVLDACGIGQQAVMADAVESRREDMEQEAAHELLDRERHPKIRS